MTTSVLRNLFLIVAMDKNNGIGRQNTIPWNIPEDMRYFRDTTVNHTVIMGRKTADSIYSKNNTLLKQRKNLILSTQLEHSFVDATIYNNINDIIRLIVSEPMSKFFVIGGAQIYSLLLPYCCCIYLTRIHKEFLMLDVFFGSISGFTKISEKTIFSEYENCFVSFETWIRNSNF